MTISNEWRAAAQSPVPESTPSKPPSSTQENGTTSGFSRAKLHGRKFYEDIGSPKFILAPMVDQSEFAWRLLTRSFMTPASNSRLLAYTPMLHARMFIETPKFRDTHFQPLRTSLSTQHPTSTSFSPTDLFLDGNPTLDRPLTVQFCANDPDEFLNAARYVAPFCDAVDLNLGCPQGIARKGKYGAFLQEDQDLIFRLINNLHINLSVPITAKIRILDTKERTLEYARLVLRAGASILTVHGRQRDQKGHKTGLADWSVLRYLRDNLPPDTVLFANGNILKRGDIDACIAATGADGVMSAEGNLCDPAIFAEEPAVGEEGREFWRGRDGRGGWRMDAVFRRYMDILYKYVLEVPIPERKPLYLPCDSVDPPPIIPGQDEAPATHEIEEGPPRKKQKMEKREKTTSPNLLAMQAHLFRLLRPLVKRHHHVRDALARCRAGDIAAFEGVLGMVEEVVRVGLMEYEERESEGRSWDGEVQEVERVNKVEVDGDGGAGKEKGDLETRDGDVGGDKDQVDVYESSLETVRLCRRPWWVVQPYVRPLPREALAKGSLTLSRKEKEKEAAKAARVNGGGVMGEESQGGEVEKGGEAGKKEGVNGSGAGSGEKNRSGVGLGLGILNGHVELEKLGDESTPGVGNPGEEVEVPKEGLVCG